MYSSQSPVLYIRLYLYIYYMDKDIYIYIHYYIHIPEYAGLLREIRWLTIFPMNKCQNSTTGEPTRKSRQKQKQQRRRRQRRQP